MAVASALFAVVCMAALRKPVSERAAGGDGEPAASAGSDASQPAGSESLGEELDAAILRTNEESREALARGDAAAYSQRFAEDSISLPGSGPIVRGRPAIEEAMREAFRKARFRGAEWRTIATEVDGASAFEIGAYKFLIESEASRPKTLSGRYFVVWKKIGLAWKIAVDASQPGASGD
jgi:uncharacterized protein (TIGR02246 family)